MKRFLIVILKVVLYVAFLLLLMYGTPKVLSKVLHTQYPMAAITSGSMWPVLKTGDLILMKGAHAGEVSVGQIIVFKNTNGFTIHRLIRKEGERYITKGDANNVEDRPIQASDIVGRAVYMGEKPFRVPKLGFMAKYVSSKLGK